MSTKLQETATKLLLENPELSISKAMTMAGYSATTAKNPKHLTNSEYYQTAMIHLLEKHQVTQEQYFRNLGMAMQANHTVMVEGDVIETEQPNLSLRLQANKQAERHLFDDTAKNPGTNNLPPQNNEEIKEQLASKDIDAVELARVTFKDK